MKPAALLLFALCGRLLMSALAPASGPQDDKDAVKTLLALSTLPEAELNEMLADRSASHWN
jgi:hypothetical protein